MLAPPGAPRVSRAAHREPRQSCSSVARQSRTGLLDEVDGVPLALDPASLFLSGCRNSNLDDILTSALLRGAIPFTNAEHNLKPRRSRGFLYLTKRRAFIDSTPRASACCPRLLARPATG